MIITKLDNNLLKGVETTIFTDFASGNIAQMALDLDNGKMWLGNNGTWYNNNNASNTPANIEGTSFWWVNRNLI